MDVCWYKPFSIVLYGTTFVQIGFDFGFKILSWIKLNNYNLAQAKAVLAEEKVETYGNFCSHSLPLSQLFSKKGLL